MAEDWPNKPRKVDGLTVAEMPSGWSAHAPGDETAHFLNASSALILELCDGEHDAQAIAEIVQQAFELAEVPLADVREFLDQARAAGLVEPAA